MSSYYNNNYAQNLELIPERPWADGIVNDYKFCSYPNMFAYNRFSYGTNGHYQGNALSLDPFLGVRSANLLASIFAAIVERRFLARFGSEYDDVMNDLPDLSRSGSCFPFLFKNGLDFCKPARRVIHKYFEDAVEKLIEGYRNPRPTTKTFGTIFPDCPNDKLEIPEIDEPVDIASLVYAIIDASRCGAFDDITKRHRKIGTYNGYLLEETFGGSFDITPAERYPTYRHVISLVRGIAESGLKDFLDGYFCIGTSAPGCSLPCSQDRVLEWMNSLWGALKSGTGSGVTDKYTHVFGKSGTGKVTGCRYNSFAVTLAVAILAQFNKYQFADLNVSMGCVKHLESILNLEMGIRQNDDGKWVAYNSSIAGDCPVYEKSRFKYEFEISSYHGFSVDVVKINTLKPVIMIDPETCKEVHTYYRENGWDEPYRTPGQDRWIWSRTVAEFNTCAATLSAHRTLPWSRGRTLSEECNTIGLNYSEQNFPNLAHPNVKQIVKKLHQYQFGRYDYTGSDGIYNRNIYVLKHNEFNKEESHNSCVWYRDAAFCIANEYLAGGNALEECVGRQIKSQGFSQFGNVCSSFNASYFGFGSQEAMDSIASDVDDLIGEREEEEEEEEIPGEDYEYICYRNGVWVGRVNGYWWDVVFEKYGYSDDTYKISCVKLNRTWDAYENGSGGHIMGNARGSSGITFGGYFQVIEWDFSVFKKAD